MSDSLQQLLKTHNQKQAEVKRQNGKEKESDKWSSSLRVRLNIRAKRYRYLENLKKNAIQVTNELTDSLTEYVNEG